MNEDLIEHVLYLIDAKKGDSGRLNYILSMLQDGRQLYISDKKYLESLVATYIEPSKRKTGQQSVEELKAELGRVKQKLERYEKRGYKKAIGRKAGFFFVTFFFGWHAVVKLLGDTLQLNQNTNPYLFPLYQIKTVLPQPAIAILSQYNIDFDQIIVFAWALMMLTWIILGFAYLVKFMRSRYNPALH
ncbi:MAG TPA: hypothetical protein VJ792_10185 [Candidatus Nitrosotalea sp.]|nr:hypothetical protein [Candidatus Nitrosotalea sp.]